MFSGIESDMVGKKQTEIFVWAMLAVLLVWIAIMAGVPPVSRDALTHHLAVPKLYLQSGGIHEIPEVEFSYYPMNLDMIYMIPLYFGNDIIPKYIHFGFGILTALLIYRFLRVRTAHRFWAVLGALLFLSLPVIIKLSITVYVDLGLVFFSTAALLYIIRWALHGQEMRHLIFAAIFCGLCLGTKYNGLITFFLLACSIPILYLRWHFNQEPPSAENGGVPPEIRSEGMDPIYRALGAALIFVFVSLAVFSPWMIRNYKWTGNPVHPLYQSLFRPNPSAEGRLEDLLPTGPESVENEEERLSHFVIRKRVFNETLLQAISTPVRIFFQGEDDNPKYFDGRLNPYLFIFPLLAFIGFFSMTRRRQFEYLALAGFSVLFLLYTFFKVDMRIRYVAPIIPPLVILAVLGIENIYTIFSSRLKGAGRTIGLGVLAVSVLCLLGLNAHYLVGQSVYVSPLRYLRGDLDRDAYIKKYRSEYDAIQFVNRNISSDARILSIYLGNRIYYSDRKMVCNDLFIKAAVKSSNSAKELYDKLKAGRFTHLLIRSDFFRYFILDQLSPEKKRMVDQFFREKTTGIFSHNGYSVFEMKQN